MSSQKISGAWQFSLVWLVLNAAGWGVGFGLELLILHSASMSALSNLFGSLVAAGIIGLVQWLALRWLLAPMRAGSQGIAWVILTMFGYTAGFLVAGLVTGLFGENLTPEDAAKITFLAWGLVGLFTGGLQWMGLQFFTRGAAWWVGANALGYALGGTLMSVIRIEQVVGPEIYALAGLVAGAVTLVAITRLRRRVLIK
jgi:biotin transporter BioY